MTSRGWRRFAAVAVALSVVAAAAAAAAGSVETDATYRALRSAVPDGKTLAVRDLVLERDVFRFRIESGAFQFLTAVEGRSYGAVFSGRATFELRPASERERRYLALMTGEKGLEVLSEPLTSVVFLFSDSTAAEIEKRGTPSAPIPDAAAIFQAFFKKQRSDWKTNFQIRLLADALRGGAPPAGGGVFVAAFIGKKIGTAVMAVDPAGLDWLVPDVGGEGSALVVLDDSQPRLWYSSPARGASETAADAPPPAKAIHYAIETTIHKNAEIDATTTIRFRPLQEGVRVLPIHLLDKLRIREVSLASGEGEAWTPVPFIQEAVKEDADAAVVLPPALATSKEFRLRLTYGGTDVLKDAGDGNFLVGARESWYPNLATFSNPASFDLTYRCPKAYEVVSVGTRVEDRLDGDTRVFRFRQDRPIRVAGFNYGKFKKVERTDSQSGLTITVYTNTGTPDFIQELNLLLRDNRGGLSYIPVDTAGFADSAMADGINMARAGTAFFGPLPEKRLAITQQTQAFFGQSWPSLVYLPFVAALDGTIRHELGLQGVSSFVDEVGPHEVAHQWWGHLVGWNNYRDAWLSEGFAEFSASLVLQAVEGGRKFNPFWERRRTEIEQKPRGSLLSNDAAGPITMGWRLATRKSPEAAQALVYAKGAYILHMLRMAMRQYGTPNPDAKFIEMMKDFVATWSDKNPSTRDFQTIVERHMSPALDLAGDGKMDWFFRQWVDGIEIPRYRSKFEITKAGAQYKIHGSVTQDGVSADFRTLAHLYLEFPKGELVHFGVVRMTGTLTIPLDTTVRLPREPKRIVLNAMHDVLSRD